MPLALFLINSEWLVIHMLYMLGLRTCVELYIVGLCLHFSKYGQCLLSCQCFHASLSFHLDVQGDSYNAHSCWPLSSSSELSPGSQALYKLIQTHGSSRVPLCQSIPCCVCNCSSRIVTDILQASTTTIDNLMFWSQLSARIVGEDGGVVLDGLGHHATTILHSAAGCP